MPSPPFLNSASPLMLHLPDAPAELQGAVKAWEQEVEIATYLPEAPEKCPMFLEKRVYQGSSGRVYPLPFIDRIATEPQKKLWKAIHIENEFLRLMILPEIGGRIHIGFDKTTGYDFFYRQNVIKPALVGLAGPWISGGVEFNWPQHHRPATFMPVSTEIEHEADGSITVWCSDHDPMLRMKGMHGVCLRPNRAVLELKVRLYNRTPFTQTFLWWANVATRVHEQYQSFFPTDVRFVADHAKRAVTSFPLSNGHYYGIDYAERGRSGVPDDEKPRTFVPDGSYPPNDLSWYANIPVPTSYMIAGTEQDFFGGYDHKAEAGVVHVANHHIAPGKKQWTWGNHEFGYAWDRSLTDSDGPYIELMAGVYTDNQPDFSYLAPWETRTFTQNWYPIHAIGVPVAANADAALSMTVSGASARVGVYVTRPVANTTITLRSGGQPIAEWTQDLSVSSPAILTHALSAEVPTSALAVLVTANGATLIEYDPSAIAPAKPPVVAQEPATPDQIATVEDLYLTGLHLEQYRHATRQPEPYWQEALRRDPAESRVHNALGLWHLRRGELESAAAHFEAAIQRLTHLNPNPRDGEPYYNLGLTRRYQGQPKAAYDAFYKATWNAAWRGPSYFALAELDAARRDWNSALDHVQRSLRADADNLNARNLLGTIYLRMGHTARAQAIWDEIRTVDPLDIGARWREGIAPANGQECLDLAFDLLRAGQHAEALQVLESADLTAHDGTAPMLLLTAAYIQAQAGMPGAEATYRRAASAPLDYCFPSRLEEMLVLQWTIATHEDDWTAHYLLGNLLYDNRRYDEAMTAWEAAAAGNPAFAIAHRNLGIAYFNIRQDQARAIESFDRAFRADPTSGRILYERDQLWKRIGESPERRLQELLQHADLVDLRDDLSVELATLYNQVDRPQDALALLLRRKFQPWEGGEGLVLAQYMRARLLLGQRALQAGDPSAALEEFEAILQPPENLSESRHLLANQSEVYYWIGTAYQQLGATAAAQTWWLRATRHKGDFQQMSVRSISGMTFWSALALRRLGKEQEAEALFHQIQRYAHELEQTAPKIDYFATSLPAMLLFDEDLQRTQRVEVMFLSAQAFAGLGDRARSENLLGEVLHLDRNHAGAADLLRQLTQPSQAVPVR